VIGIAAPIWNIMTEVPAGHPICQANARMVIFFIQIHPVLLPSLSHGAAVPVDLGLLIY
jgi:hypothetical protein